MMAAEPGKRLLADTGEKRLKRLKSAFHSAFCLCPALRQRKVVVGSERKKIVSRSSKC